MSPYEAFMAPFQGQPAKALTDSLEALRAEEAQLRQRLSELGEQGRWLEQELERREWERLEAEWRQRPGVWVAVNGRACRVVEVERQFLCVEAPRRITDFRGQKRICPSPFWINLNSGCEKGSRRHFLRTGELEQLQEAAQNWQKNQPPAQTAAPGALFRQEPP